VTFAEFNALLRSLLSTAVVGHPAWRFEPSFAETDPRETVRAINLGGRPHTFTEVAEFWWRHGSTTEIGLTEAPGCADATVIPLGDRQEIRGLAAGDHKFQCCIHPWMRALIKVEDKHDDSALDDAAVASLIAVSRIDFVAPVKDRARLHGRSLAPSGRPVT